MNLLKFINKIFYSVYENFFMNFFIDDKYGEIGYFVKKNPHTKKYFYANWGSREWEYRWVENVLNQIEIKNKKIVDIGIGLPTDSDFYKFYIKSDSFLTAFDPDSRLDKIIPLSSKCKIIRKSAEKMDIPSATIDVVVCISSFEHFPVENFKKTIKEIHRVLKRNGHLMVTLDLTFNKLKSARWAVLEKTIAGLPATENNLRLKPEHQQLTLQYFLKMVSPYFTVKNKIIKNKRARISELVYSKKWNSYVTYLHLYKKA